MIAQILIPPALTAPVAVVSLAALAWYWWRLGRPDVSIARRRVRRASLVIFAAMVGIALCGLSFVDPETSGRAFVAVWSIVLLGALAMIVVAGLDALASLHGHRRRHQRERFDTVHEISTLLRDRDADRGADQAGAVGASREDAS